MGTAEGDTEFWKTPIFKWGEQRKRISARRLRKQGSRDSTVREVRAAGHLGGGEVNGNPRKSLGGTGGLGGVSTGLYKRRSAVISAEWLHSIFKSRGGQ